MPQAELITIPVSHFCERARWALEQAQIDYQETPALQLFHRLQTRRIGAGRTVPALRCEDQVFGDSNQILAWIQQQSQTPNVLGTWAPGDARDKQMVAWGDGLAVDTRLMVYDWMMPHKDLLLKTNNQTAPAWQGWLLRAMYPMAMKKISSILSISKASVELAHQRVLDQLDWVEQKIAKAPYLYLDSETPQEGSSFSALDLTMATYLAPIALPKEYGAQPGFLPRLEECPPKMQAFITSMHKRPGVQWALKMFRQHRRSPIGGA